MEKDFHMSPTCIFDLRPPLIVRTPPLFKGGITIFKGLKKGGIAIFSQKGGGDSKKGGIEE